MVDNQKDLFPVGGETLVKKTDPQTSRDAAHDIKSSSRLGKLQIETYNLVVRYPGSAAQELDILAGDPGGVKIARRLSELQRKGRVYSAGVKTNPVSGKKCLRWWPSEF